MSARRTRGGDLKDSKEEEGEEAVAVAEADMMMAGHEVTSDAVDATLSTESSRGSKKRRVSTREEASNEFLESATEEDRAVPDCMTSVEFSTALSAAVEPAIPIDGLGDAGKVGGGTMQCASAAGQASTSESTAHSERGVDDARASAYRLGALGSGDAAVTVAAVASYKSVISSLARANESNFITAENYYLLHWLCRIRNVSCPRGLRISFLQPDFLWSIYRPMMRSKKLWRTDGDIRVAADLWCFDRDAAEERYGHISDWDVSSVTDMSELFQGEDENEPMEDRHRGKDLFNDDISRWDVSKVTNMSWMFDCASAFNQPLANWDVSNVTNMAMMLCDARSFNQAIGDWDVSNVTDMQLMLCSARSFNQPVGDWNVSKVTSMGNMFTEAHAFDQPIGGWNVSNVTDMDGMFDDTVAFNQDLTRWDNEGIRYYSVEIDGLDNGMFKNAQSMQRVNMPFAVREGLATAVAPPL